jgi:hypothetical protein
MEVSGQLQTVTTLPPLYELPVLIGYEADWASDPVWTLWRREESLVPDGNRTLTVQPIAHLYTD